MLEPPVPHLARYKKKDQEETHYHLNVASVESPMCVFHRVILVVLWCVSVQGSGLWWALCPGEEALVTPVSLQSMPASPSCAPGSTGLSLPTSIILYLPDEAKSVFNYSNVIQLISVGGVFSVYLWYQ